MYGVSVATATVLVTDALAPRITPFPAAFKVCVRVSETYAAIMPDVFVRTMMFVPAAYCAKASFASHELT